MTGSGDMIDTTTVNFNSTETLITPDVVMMKARPSEYGDYSEPL